ncbi:hypothetical protein M758_1G129300 [Ceratodon purpureus]|nr:hypothetical protein M758_1G129300 [Ceratodon purpureus]
MGRAFLYSIFVALLLLPATSAWRERVVNKTRNHVMQRFDITDPCFAVEMNVEPFLQL